MNYTATKQHVANRGVAPNDFLDQLVAWGKTARNGSRNWPLRVLEEALFEMGPLTSGQAAQLAWVSRVAFLLSCPQWIVPSVAWDAAEFKPLPA